MARGVHRILVCSLAASALPFLATAAAAEDCSLRLLNSVPLTVGADNVVTAPASVAGKEKPFQIDTAAAANQMGADAIKDFGLGALDYVPSLSGGAAATSTMTSGARGSGTSMGGATMEGDGVAIFNAQGTMFHSMVDAKQFAFGAMRVDDLQFVATDFPKPGTGGILNADFFRKFDIDLNFWGGSFNMFAPNHCAGQVVYWRTPGVAKLPMRFQNNRIGVRVSVDGKEMDALIDTGSPRSEMKFQEAGRLFGVTATTPGVALVGEANEKSDLNRYSYDFKTLSFGDVYLNNPHLVLTRDILVRGADPNPRTGTLLRNSADQSSQPSLLIGADLLKRLHIYIAFGERMIYITQGPELAEGDAKAIPAVAVTPFRP
jgi:hypothetical protein